MEQKYVLGIDIGGTITKLGVIECINDKKFLLKDVQLIPSLRGKENLDVMVNRIVNVVKSFKKKYKLYYCGIGVAALVDPSRGIVIDAPNLMLKNVNLKQKFESKTGLKILLDNDANVAAVAIYFTEVKQKYPQAKNMVCFTLGTGIGGGIIINGELLHLGRFSSYELGHIIINPDGELCGCGGYGCLERYIGARWFVKNIQELLKSSKPKTVLYEMLNNKIDKLTTEILYNAAEKGDKFALSQWACYGRYLGIAVSSLINILTPQVVTFTGGVANAYKFFLPTVKQEVKRRVWPKVKLAEKIKYHIAVKQNYGVIGAGILAYKTFLAK